MGLSAAPPEPVLIRFAPVGARSLISGGLLSEAHRRVDLFGRWPLASSHVSPSLIAPLNGEPSERLLDIALQAAGCARTMDLSSLSVRRGDDVVVTWPGEHYRLLAALVDVLQPRRIVEIGTATGISALAMKSRMPADGKITTFDVVGWQGYPEGVLREDDFADGRLEQRIEDLSYRPGLTANADVLREAELIFVDAKHDGAQEERFVSGFEEVGLAAGPVVVFDDIRLWRMLSFWARLRRPKLDITSLGHWSGTGLVDYADSRG